jgi:hypothetical protein
MKSTVTRQRACAWDAVIHQGTGQRIAGEGKERRPCSPGSTAKKTKFQGKVAAVETNILLDFDG